MSLNANGPHPANILLVEDNDINQMLALEVLARSGWSCDTAINGVEAITMIKARRYDLILMDCQMPIMDGFTATREIREMESAGQITPVSTIVAVTANALKGDRQRCLDAGMDDYLAKPFSPEQLTEIVAKWLANVTPTPVAEDCSSEDYPSSDLLDPPICEKEFLGRCMGDLAFAELLLNSFEKDSVARLEQISSQADQGDTGGVGATAHSLKGIAGIIAAPYLKAIALDIETAGNAGRLDQVTTLVDDLRNELDRCLSYIQVLKRQNSTTVPL